MKSTRYGSRFALALAIGVIACIAWSGVARAEMIQTVETNIAYGRTVYASPSGVTYYQPTTIYTTWNPVLNDDINYTNPNNFLYNNRNINSYFRIDLTGSSSKTTTVKWIDVICRGATASYWDPYLTQCYLQGLNGAGSLIAGYEVEIPAVTLEASGARSWQTTVNWTGVRYVRIYDKLDVNGTTTDDDLMLSELRVGGDVNGYANFIGNVGVTATSEGADLYGVAANLTNNRGMTDQGAGVGNPAAKSIVTSGNWLSTNLLVEDPENPGTYIYTDAPVVTFDLGGTYGLDRMVIWNYNWATSTASYTFRGTKECLIEYSNDGGVTYTALDDRNIGLGNYTIAQAPTDVCSSSYPMYSYQASVNMEGRYADHVRITALSNYGNDSATASYRGLGEVRFYVPEPSTFLGLVALGLVGLARWRRR